MAHPRKLIRHGIVAVVIAANTAAGTRVYPSRVDPFKKGSLPAAAVYILSEEIDQDATEGTAPRELERIANVEIVGFVGAADSGTLADAIDDLSEELEAAMDEDPYLDGAVGDSMLVKTDIEIREGDGQSDPLIGIVTLTYAVTYRTQPGAVTATDDFLTVDATHQIVGGVEDTTPAEDLFVVQEVVGGDEYT